MLDKEGIDENIYGWVHVKMNYTLDKNNEIDHIGLFLKK